MDITGKIISVLPTRSGTSAKGTQWSSQTSVIETHEQYPKKVAFDVLGEKITEFNLQVGEEVTVSFDINAREFNGKWFNSVNAWHVTRVDAQQGAQQPLNYGNNPQNVINNMAGPANPTNPQNPYPPIQNPAKPQGDSSDLPF
nr:MAG: single-stranded DNA binding protein [Bacteriophage sp.]